MILPMSTMLNGIKVVTVREVAHAMRVSPMTVYRMIKSGELEAVRVGRNFRIHEKSFEAYLDSHGGAE